jgi:hypothetical protein
MSIATPKKSASANPSGNEVYISFSVALKLKKGRQDSQNKSHSFTAAICEPCGHPPGDASENFATHL